jgi:hypothetical protein
VRILDSKEGRLFIFIDTYSIERRLRLTNSSNLDRLSRYFKSNLFEFVRTPFETNYEALRQVTKFILKYERIDDLHDISIEYKNELVEGSYMMGFNRETINLLAQQLFGNEVNKHDLESTTWLFANNEWSRRNKDRRNLFVTFNSKLLKENTVVSKNLSKNLLVVNLVDAMYIMDLYAKSQHGRYLYDSHASYNPGLWYWHSFRSKVPHYNVPDRDHMDKKHIMEEFANRFTYLLCSLDNIGIQYFFPTDSDFFVQFNFNYFILLVTGIFDCLAIETKDKYKLKFDYDVLPNKTTLYSKLGKQFLQALEKVNIYLRGHISLYSNFIHLVYSFREYAIHREGFRIMGLIAGFREPQYGTNRYTVDKNVVTTIKATGYKSKELSEWGISYVDPFIFLEPYKFCKTIITMLVEFSDKYLELLGFSNFTDSALGKDMKSFELTRLGF